MDQLKRKNNSGFSTVEIMIALAIMTLVLTAVIVVIFSNQTFSIDSETNNEAMKLAQGLLEEQQALARKDFNLVNSSDDPIIDGIYTKNINVNTISDSDYLTKEVVATITWKNERGMDKTLELTTLISNFDSPVGGNTCDSDLMNNITSLPEDWTSPEIENSETDFAKLIGQDPLSKTYTITDVDAYGGYLYVTAGQTTGINDDTLFIFDVSDGENIEFLDSIDNASNVFYGLNTVRVAENPASNPIKTYAYAGSNTRSDYSTCSPNDPLTGKACSQLYIFDVSDPDSPSLQANLKLSSTPNITGQTQVNTLFYKNNYVFLGLGATTGPEFNIVDVHNPEDIPSGIYPVAGSFETQVGINALNVRNSFAYLGLANTSTPSTTEQELRILNVSSLSNPFPGDSLPYYGFNSDFGAGHGKSIALVGDKLYLSKTSPNTGFDLHILDNSNPASVLDELGGVDVVTSVNGVIVRDYLSFLLTNSELKIFRTDDPSDISSWGDVSLPVSGSATEPSMDCEGNRIYISSNDATGKGAIFIIKPE